MYIKIYVSINVYTHECELSESMYKPLHKHIYVYLGIYMKAKVLVPPSCLSLCDPTDCNSPGSFVHGILQAGILEWVASPFSK